MTRMDKALYERELARLQVDLVSMQRSVNESGARIAVVFEGRDAAGKGGAIKRIMQYLNPRSARVVRAEALGAAHGSPTTSRAA